MPVFCCIKNCKSKWKKNSEVKFYRFPNENENIIQYWIAATGHDNWSPYSGSRICSLHFKDSDYYHNKKHIKRRRLKPDIFPTQHVHTNILEILHENRALHNEIYKNKKYDKIGAIANEDESTIGSNDEITASNLKYDEIGAIANEDELTIGSNDEITASNLKYDEIGAIANEDELTIGNNDEITASNLKYDEIGAIANEDESTIEGNEITALNLKCSKCLKYDELLHKNEQLQKKINEMDKLIEERLNQQASMFHTLMKHKEVAVKNKVKLIKVRNKTLNKNIQRKGKNISNLKLLFKHIKDKNILENDVSSRLSNEFGNLLVPLLENKKKK